MEYFIYMTNNCNLCCEYCSVLLDCEESNMPLEPTYSWQKLRQFIINTQEGTFDQEAVIYFFGGEPSLRYQNIIELINTLGNKLDNIDIKYVLHTNGLLLNKIPTNISDNLHLVMHSLNYEKFPFYNPESVNFVTNCFPNIAYFRCLLLVFIVQNCVPNGWKNNAVS